MIYLYVSIVYAPFYLSTRAWVALSISLKRKKEQASVGLKNELGLTPRGRNKLGFGLFLA